MVGGDTVFEHLSLDDMPARGGPIEHVVSADSGTAGRLHVRYQCIGPLIMENLHHLGVGAGVHVAGENGRQSGARQQLVDARRFGQSRIGFASLIEVRAGELHQRSVRSGAELRRQCRPRLAIRGEANWLPIWIDPEVGSFACGTVELGGCLVVLTGRLTQQFQLSVGPVLRF